MDGTARRARLAEALLYLCVDGRRDKGDLAAFLDAALAGGVDIVQLREKGLEAREEMAIAEVFAAAARRHGALFAVNDRADVARVVGADVLHVGQGDLPPDVARSIVGAEVLIGLSSHSPAEASAASHDADVDYFCVGPTWPTPTKPGRPAPGLPLVEHAVSIGSARPWFAIGGIDSANLGRVLDAGAQRIVVVRAITEAADPEAAARALKSRLVS
ncbi:MAG TPA: thiamine phosphate synthase [Mycobacteriales bacterium]|nr:thiamine phosphate synthase [Mycobacteriales bacterium]HVX69032.1 thiamine phosphate synthase [Mycobacteriales bacterium]